MELNLTHNNSSMISLDRKKNTWTKVEDQMLLALSEQYGYRNWKEISNHFVGKNPIQCSARYKRIRPGLIKGVWKMEEDKYLLELVKKFGKNWSLLAKYMPSRTGKQIRDRYLNSLDPHIKKERFSSVEDKKIILLYSKYGKYWSKIAKYFMGRTGDMIKNRFYSSIKKKLNCLNLIQIKYIYDLNAIQIESKDISDDFIDKIFNDLDNSNSLSLNYNSSTANDSSSNNINGNNNTSEINDTVRYNNNDTLNNEKINSNLDKSDIDNNIEGESSKNQIDYLDDEINKSLICLIQTMQNNKDNELDSQVAILNKMINIIHQKIDINQKEQTN